MGCCLVAWKRVASKGCCGSRGVRKGCPRTKPIYLREPAECAPISSPCKLFYFLAPGVAYLTNLTGLVDRSEGEIDRSCSMSKATLVDLWPSMRRTVSLG